MDLWSILGHAAIGLVVGFLAKFLTPGRDPGSILGHAAIGLVVGFLAKFLTPGRDPGGFFVTMAIGVAGSFLATFGGQALGFYQVGQTAGFFGSLVGAIVLLLIIRVVRRGQAGPTA